MISTLEVFAHCNVLDIMSDEWHYNCDIIVEGEQIVDILPSSSMWTSEQHVIDLRNGWVIPGLIDLHVHICDEPNPQKDTSTPSSME